MPSTTHIEDENLQRAVQQELEWTPDVLPGVESVTEVDNRIVVRPY